MELLKPCTRKVYLAGPIHKCSDSEVCQWRQYAQKRLDPIECVDPTHWDMRGKEDIYGRRIVELDKTMIMGCKIILANLWRREMCGTLMEILFAWEQHKMIYAVTNGIDYGPWLEYHAMTFATLDDAIDSIRKDNGYDA